MAQAVCCDRCGKFAKADSKEVGAWISLSESSLAQFQESSMPSPEKLLCSSCKVKFEDFMRPPVVREG